jgi:hypothetical protein
MAPLSVLCRENPSARLWQTNRWLPDSDLYRAVLPAVGSRASAIEEATR